MEKREKYDVVVVGGGPAGLMAALEAAKRGLDVLLIEEHLEIGSPVSCAEAVEAEKLIPFFRIETECSECISWDLKGLIIVPPNGVDKVFMEGDGYILDRRIFDKFLSEEAIRTGAEIIVGNRVVGVIKGEKKIIVKTKKRDKFSADIVIGADGFKSKIGEWAGIDTRLKPPDFAVCQQFLLTGVELEEPDRAEFFVGNPIAPKGYAWIFPKGENAANVGLGIPSGIVKSVMPYLKSFVKSKFSRYEIVEKRGGIVPVAPIKKLTANGVVLVGDAARVVNPLSGGGIIPAMKSGFIAGQVVSKAILQEDTSVRGLIEYEKRVWEEIGRVNKKLLRVRKFIQRLTDDELNFLAQHLKNVDVLNVSSIDFIGLITGLALKNPRMLAKFLF